MKHHRLLTALAVAVVLATATCGYAAVVTVTPDNMQGWTIVTNQVVEDNATCRAVIANYGYAVAQRNAGKAWVAEDGMNFGSGAYYVGIDYGGLAGTPPTTWLGTDTFNGQPLAGVTLNSITKLQYYTLNAQFPTLASGGADAWGSWTYREYPREPIMLQFTIESPDGTDRKQIWFMPWKKILADPSDARGEKSGQYTKKWWKYDAINWNSPANDMQPRWYCPNPATNYLSWTEMTAAFGTYHFVATSNDDFPTGYKSAGWDASTTPIGSPECTATGMPLNFVMGARKALTDIFFTPAITWANDYRGFRGYMDLFTLGINGVDVTYNFEPSANAIAPKVVAINNRAAFDTILYRDGSAQPPAQDKYMAKISGLVTKINGVGSYIDDGSATKDALGAFASHYLEWWLYSGPTMGAQLIRQNPALTGEYWSAIGILERSCLQGTKYPSVPIWTAAKENAGGDLLNRY